MTAVIQADIQGLEAMAGRFGTLGGQVAAASTPVAVGAVGQATARATTGVDTSATAAGTALAGRMRATTAKVTTGAGKHAAQEADSAAALAALSPPPVAAG